MSRRVASRRVASCRVASVRVVSHVEFDSLAMHIRAHGHSQIFVSGQSNRNVIYKTCKTNVCFEQFLKNVFVFYMFIPCRDK